MALLFLRVRLCAARSSGLPTLIELAEHLFAGKVEQLVGGNRRDGLLKVAHGLKPSSVQPGLAEPRDGVILGVRYRARCCKALALRAEFALLADVITAVVWVHCFPEMLVRGCAATCGDRQPGSGRRAIAGVGGACPRRCRAWPGQAC